MKYILVMLLAVYLLGSDDMQLVKLAYKSGLKPVPANYKSLLQALHTDEKELSKEKIALGKNLFFDNALSLNRDISCATCHRFNKGGTDAISTAIGHEDQKNPFHLNSPTVFNTAFSKNFFWDGRSKSLQDQAKGPLQAPFEMSMTPSLAEKRLSENNEYVHLFETIYGKDAITFENIVNAIAAYEKTLVTRGRFDDYLIGNFHALNQEEKEGLTLFISKSCIGCHNGIGLGGQRLRKFPLTYHKIWSMQKPMNVKVLHEKYARVLAGLADQQIFADTEKINYLKSKISQKEFSLLEEGFFDQVNENVRLKVMASSACMECHKKNNNEIRDETVKKVSFPFENKGGFLGSKDPQQYFRVPLLRNVVRTQPYFHNGSIEKLEDAIKIMGTHQSRVNLSDDEIDKIISFLKAVDGEFVEYGMMK